MKTKEIYLIQVDIGYCHDIRPCVIVEILNADRVKVAAISAALDLYRTNLDFSLDSKHQDFASTGLHKTSYVSGSKFFDVPVDKLNKRLGYISENMAKAFDVWYG